MSSRSTKWFLLSLFLVSLGIRSIILLRTDEFPGDGPFRALISYAWSCHPIWVSSNYWLPGHFYLAGLLMKLYPDPYWAVRILNTFLGALCPVLLFLLSRRCFAAFPASMAAIVLALLPLHLGLSTSSLGEIPTLFMILLSLWLYTNCFPVSIPAWSTFCLVTATAVLLLAEMTRPDTWLFVPFVVFYVMLAAKSAKLGLTLLLLLTLFPAYWLFSCNQELGQPLISFASGDDPRNEKVSLLISLRIILQKYLYQAGPLVLLGGLSGFVLVLRELREWKTFSFWYERAEKLLFIFVFLVMGACLTGLGMAFGSNFQDRYMLNFLVFSLPLCGIAIANFPWVKQRLSSEAKGKRISACVLVGLITVNSVLLTFMFFKPPINITTKRWDPEFAFADWFMQSKYAESPILLTSINYRSFFIPLKHPAILKNCLIVMDFWTPYYNLRDELNRKTPTLLVVGDDDGKDLAYLLAICNFQIDQEHPVFEVGHIKAFRILPGSFRVKRDCEIQPTMKSFLYPEPCWRTFFQRYKRRPYKIMLAY